MFFFSNWWLKSFVRAFSFNSQNYVHMTLICVQDLNTLVNVIIGCQTAEILELKVAKTQVKLRNELDCYKTITSVSHMPVGRSAKQFLFCFAHGEHRLMPNINLLTNQEVIESANENFLLEIIIK